jgi:hypothetical protein
MIRITKRLPIVIAITLSFALVAPLTGASSSLSTSSDWITTCRSSGFDPVQLACNTCKFLPEAIQTKCQECCQSYLDVERITKPFRSAVLVQMTRTTPTEGELGNFFEHDWDDVLVAKGTDKLVKIIDESAVSSRNKMKNSFDGGNMFFQFFSGPQETAEIFFLEEPLPTKRSLLTYEHLSKIAKETFPLDGMKREDVKDMILSLLP